MRIAVLRKWGNSMGVRLSKRDVEKMHLHAGEQFKVSNEKGKLVLEPITDLQAGWLEAFNAMADAHETEWIIGGNFDNDFDKKEWAW